MEFSRPEYWSLSLLQGIFPTQELNSGLPHCRTILYQLSHEVSPPKNTGVSSLSLLQGFFLTQEFNWGLLHHRWILYELSYQGVGTNTFLLNTFSLPKELSSHESLTATAANFVVLWPEQTNLFDTSSPRNFQLSVDNHLVNSGGFPSGSDGKSICLQCGRPGFDPWVVKMPWRRKWQPTPVPLPGKSHGWRSLVGYSPWGRKESDMTE